MCDLSMYDCIIDYLYEDSEEDNYEDYYNNNNDQ